MRLTGPASDGKALEDVVVCGGGAAAICGFAKLAAGAGGSELWTSFVVSCMAWNSLLWTKL